MIVPRREQSVLSVCNHVRDRLAGAARTSPGFSRTEKLVSMLNWFAID